MNEVDITNSYSKLKAKSNNVMKARFDKQVTGLKEKTKWVFTKSFIDRQGRLTKVYRKYNYSNDFARSDCIVAHDHFRKMNDFYNDFTKNSSGMEGITSSIRPSSTSKVLV